MQHSFVRLLRRGTAHSNGLKFEMLTALMPRLIESKLTHDTVVFPGASNEIVYAPGRRLFKYKPPRAGITLAHGCRHPDECFIDETTMTIFVIEKKSQSRPGSACEKLQTGVFKRWHYSRMYPGYKIVYIYCLSNWFNKHCAAELEYLALQNIPVFWGEHVDYKSKLMHFMQTHK